VNTEYERRFLFSVWDKEDGDSRQTKSTEKQVRSIEKSPYAVVRPFDGEGTGWL
jgi:hypothetical protein